MIEEQEETNSEELDEDTLNVKGQTTQGQEIISAWSRLGRITAETADYSQPPLVKRRDFPELLKYGFKYGFSGETMYATAKDGTEYWVWCEESTGNIYWYRVEPGGSRRLSNAPLSLTEAKAITS